MTLNQIKNNSILMAYSTSLLAVFSGLLTTLWLLREILQVVTKEEFGVYSLVIQICAYMNILQFSLDFAAGREISLRIGQGRTGEAISIFRNVKRYYTWITGSATLLIIVVYSSINLGFLDSIKLDHRDLTANVFLIYGSSIIVSFLSRPYAAVLIGSRGQALYNLLSIARTIFTTVLAFFLLTRGWELLSIPIAEVLGQLLFYFVMIYFFRRRCNWSTTNHSLDTSPGLVRYAALSSIGGVAWTLESSAPIILIGFFCPPELLALYVLWWKIPQMLFDVGSRLSASAFPEITRTIASGPKKLRQMIIEISYVSAGLSLLASIGVILFLSPFIQLWFGTAFVTDDTAALPLLFGTLVALRVYGNFLGMSWMAIEGPVLTTYLGWAQALITGALGMVLIHNYGVNGVIIASCFASAFQVTALMYMISRRQLGFLSMFASLSYLFAFSLLVLFLTFTFLGKMAASLLTLFAGSTLLVLAWVIIWLGGRKFLVVDSSH